MIRVIAAILVLTCMPALAQEQLATLNAAPVITCQHNEICMLETLYRERGMEAIWQRNGRLNSRGKDALAMLKQSVNHGFDPEARYHLSDIYTLLDDREDDQAPQKADFMISAALYGYLSDLNGEEIGVDAFRDAIKQRRLVQVVEGYLPDDPLYHALVKRLKANRAALNAQDTPLQSLNFGRRFLRPGNTHPAVPQLRTRLEDMGISSLMDADDPYHYSGSLVDAVKVFQTQQSEKVDGVIGPNTLRLLNRTVADEIAQIIPNLHRLRNMRRDLRADKRVEVSIAEFRLHAYDAGRVALDMPVVVGRPKRKTVSFETTIRGVRFNPGWTVPETIKKEDYLPKLQADPTYLQSKNIRIMSDWTGQAEEVDPTTIDWENMSPGTLKAMRMYKPAGRSNPLGQIRVLMHNRYDIFIHDTNSKRLFNRVNRAKSSGCVRVAEPVALTNFLFIGNKEGWDEDHTQRILKRGRTADILLDERIPVHLDYLTAWFNNDGELILGGDVYNYDGKELQAVNNSADKPYLRPLRHVNLFMDIVEEPILEAESLAFGNLKV